MLKYFLIVFMVCFVAFGEEGKSFTPYGLAQYRLRTRVRSAYTEDASVSVIDYANTISYFVGLKAAFNQISFQMQIGNDWVFTEDVNYLNNNPVVPQREFPPGSVPIFHLAYASWNPGYFNLQLGIIPVISHGPLDLLERSLSTGTYRNASHFTWFVPTNNSMMGLKLGIPILSDGVEFGADILTTVIESRIKAISSNDELIEEPNPNPTSVMFVVDLPFKSGPLTITPQFAGVLFRNYNTSRADGDHELTGGLSALYRINEKVSFNSSFAYAGVNNWGSRNPVNVRTVVTGDVAGVYDFRGLITGAGTVLNIGPGTLVIDLKYSNHEDREVENSRTDYLFGDFRYAWNIRPYLSISPRLRNFTTINPESSNVRVTMENRPELMFTATF